MAESITLQTSDSNVQASDTLGRLSFAASNEANTADARLIGASIRAEAEGDFTEISNPTSIIFSTASSESATDKLKITSSGHFIPTSNKTYDIGSSSLKFKNIYSESHYTDKIVLTSGSAPVSTTDTLYNLSGILYYDTKAVGLLPSGGTQNQILQKASDLSYDLEWIDNYSTELRVYVKNTTGSNLTKGQVVYISGAQGDHPVINLAVASGESTSSKTLGLLRQDLANNEFGYVVSEGILTGLNTGSAGSAGDTIWLSPTTPGSVVYGLANKPSAPDHLVFIGYVIRKQQNEGIVYIKPQNGFEIEELHNVRIKSLSSNDILTYNSSSGVWANTTNPSGSLNGSITTVSGMFVSGSGALNNAITSVSGSISVKNITAGSYIQVSSTTGNYTIAATGLQPSGSYADAAHAHTSSNITDFNSSVSGILPVKNITASSYISVESTTGNFTITATGLQPSGNYASSTHTHTSSNITDFNSSVSGLLPVTNIIAGTNTTVTSSSGTYTINSTGGGSIADPYDLGVYPLITISSQPSNTSVGVSGTATFNVTASATLPSGAITYQWQQSTNNSTWSNISGSTSSGLTLSNVQLSQNNYYYRCNLQSSLSNINSNSAQLSVIGFTPMAVLLTTGTSYTAPAGATSMKVWAVGAGGSSVLDGLGYGAGGTAYKTWSVSGGQSISYTVGSSNTVVTFGGVSITGYKGTATYPDYLGGTYGGGDGGANGGAGSPQPGGQGYGGAVGGNGTRTISCRTRATDVSGLFAAVTLAGGTTNETCAASGSFGAGGFSGKYNSPKTAGLGGGGAGCGSYGCGTAGSGVVVIYFT